MSLVPIPVNPLARSVQRIVPQDLYSFRAISKVSSKGHPQNRFIANTSTFILQIKPSGTVTRMVPLDEVASLERSGNRVALRVKPESKERDWLWEWYDHMDNNPRSAEGWLDVINRCRGPLVDDPTPLTWQPLDKSSRLRLNTNDGISVQERFQMYERQPKLLPRPKARARSATVQTGDLTQLGMTRGSLRTTHMIELHHLNEPLGIDFMHRIEGDSGFGGVFVTKVQPGSPADRAGVSLGQILSIAGKPIESAKNLQDAVRQAKAAQQLRFPIDICADDDARVELANLGFTHTPSTADRVPVMYTVVLDNPNEPLGLEYRAEKWTDEEEATIRVISCNPGGAADRAGLPLAPIAAVDQQTVQTADDLAAVVGIARSQQRCQLQFLMLVPAAELTQLGQGQTMSGGGTMNASNTMDRGTENRSAAGVTFSDPLEARDRNSQQLQLLAQFAQDEVQDGLSVSSDPGGEPPDPEEVFARKLHELTVQKRRGDVSVEEYARSKNRLMKMLGGGSNDAAAHPNVQQPRSSPPSSRACVNINRYVFLRQAPSRGSFWIPGGGVHGEVVVEELEGDFALVRSAKIGKRGWIHTHYLRWLPPVEEAPPSFAHPGDTTRDNFDREILDVMQRRPADRSRSASPYLDDLATRTGACPSCGRASPHEHVTFEGLGHSSPSRYPRLSAWVREEQLAPPTWQQPGFRDFHKLV
eukprot:Hpha_TRINITY_DN34809_c0_g1::TRINITY_DN34809_c0_g1_i1::g.167758::m.167758